MLSGGTTQGKRVRSETRLLVLLACLSVSQAGLERQTLPLKPSISIVALTVVATVTTMRLSVKKHLGI